MVDLPSSVSSAPQRAWPFPWWSYTFGKMPGVLLIADRQPPRSSWCRMVASPAGIPSSSVVAIGNRRKTPAPFVASRWDHPPHFHLDGYISFATAGWPHGRTRDGPRWEISKTSSTLNSSPRKLVHNYPAGGGMTAITSSRIQPGPPDSIVFLSLSRSGRTPLT